ncbi:hypothetical protein HPB48_016858 [Haemaphysalis longicornis]|uniref:Uncharacterized protein n=1 Tax=Haemaphysalis longicornis TaxID=44386 RepID=A0A9J6FUI9_HAELO|nr:hypothetical protein HPB48_016858 [Haemaphysalis longicornis]
MLSRRTCQGPRASTDEDDVTRYVGPSPWRFGSVVFLGFFLKLSGILFVLVGFNSAAPGLRLLGFVLIPVGIVVFSAGVLWAAMESWRYRAAIMAIHALDPLAASGVFLHGASVRSVSVGVSPPARINVHSAPPVDPDGPMAGLEPVHFSKYPVALPVYTPASVS